MTVQIYEGLYPFLFSYLRRGLKGRVHGNLWHVPVVDVLVTVPHAVDQISLEKRNKSRFTACSVTKLWHPFPLLGVDGCRTEL